MSVKYPDLSFTTFPNSEQTFSTMLDISQSDAILVKQYHDAILNQDFALANSILTQIPNVSQQFLTSQIVNIAFETSVALERYFLDRWSPAYIVSSTEPLGQETGDFWFDTSVVTY